MADGNCIDAAVMDGKVRPEVGAMVKADWLQRTGEIMREQGLSEPEARAVAAKELGIQLKENVKRNERLRTLHATKQLIAQGRVKQAPDGEIARAIHSMLEFDMQSKQPGEAVVQNYKRMRERNANLMLGFILKFKKSFAGMWKGYTIQDQLEIAKELWDVKSGNPEAEALAGGVKRARKAQVGDFNAAGGEIKEREKWGWTQVHDVDRMKAAGPVVWVNDIMGWLDRSSMLNDSGQPVSDKELKARLLSFYHERIKTNHHAVVARGMSPIQNRTHHRELPFKGPEEWFAYAQKYGQGDILNAIQVEMDMLARETALIQVFGPYPKQVFNTLMKDNAGKMTNIQKKSLKLLFDQVTGGNYNPGNETFAKLSKGYRAISTAAKIQSAFITGLIYDPINIARTSLYNGIPLTTVMKNYVKLFTLPSARREAAQGGFITETWLGDMVSVHRMMGEFEGWKLPSQIADVMLRLSLNTHHTEVGKNAYRLSALATITNYALDGKTWENLPKTIRSAMAERGVTKQDWVHFMETRPDTMPNGAKFIRPEQMATKWTGDEAKARQDSANRIMDWINIESNYAMVQPTEYAKAIIKAGTQPGTPLGELWKHAMLFRTFTITNTMLHGSRAIAQKSSMKRLGYYASLAVPAVVAGAAIIQLNNLASGRTIEEMDGSFWMRSMARGGAFLAFSDFLGALMDDRDQSVPSMLLGPTLGGDVFTSSEVVKNLIDAATAGSEKVSDTELGNAATNTMKLVKGLTPGSSLWYLKLAFERMFWDQVELQINPRTKKKWKYAADKQKKERGQEYYWSKGEMLP